MESLLVFFSLFTKLLYHRSNILAVCYTLSSRFIHISSRIAELYTLFRQMQWNCYHAISIAHDEIPWVDLYNLARKAFLAEVYGNVEFG